MSTFYIKLFKVSLVIANLLRRIHFTELVNVFSAAVVRKVSIITDVTVLIFRS